MRPIAAPLLALLVAFLAACGGTGIRPDGRPDYAPRGPVVASAVKDAVPRADPIHRAGNKSPYRVNGVEYRVMDDATGYRERGVASWYGQKFQIGRAHV
mgnify:CR=1 FL=1